MNDDVSTLKGLIDKFLAEGEYEIVAKLAEAAEDIQEWQEMKDFESEVGSAY